MLPKPAQYLLRFDDLSPLWQRERWEGYVALVKEFRIQPILAVIPETGSDKWGIPPLNSAFWEEMRALEAEGATIAIHGYQHQCESRGKTLLGLHRHSEFGGVELETQRAWIRAGKRILEEKGLHPKLWVAPRHGFDTNTLLALRMEGVGYLSDGFARVPFVNYGVVWMPQQLWSPVEKAKGLWTICIHPEMARRPEIDYLRSFLENHSQQFTSFDRVVNEFKPEGLELFEKLYARFALWRAQLRHARSRRKSRRR